MGPEYAFLQKNGCYRRALLPALFFILSCQFAYQELGILRGEIEELRRRLGTSEKSENNSREQLVTLTEYVGKLEREAYQSKRSMDQMNTHMRSSLETAKDREANMQSIMKQQKQKFG